MANMAGDLCNHTWVAHSSGGVPRDRRSCLVKQPRECLDGDHVAGETTSIAPFQKCLGTLCMSRVLVRHGIAKSAAAHCEDVKDETGTASSGYLL